MHELSRLLVKLLEGMFLVGMVGSALVWILATLEDVETVFSRDNGNEANAPIEVE